MALPFTRRAAISSMIAGGVTTFPRNVFIASGHAQGRAGRDWWKQAVVYQIYPRSFMDSNGDGVGDIPGVTSRLDHLAELGVDVIWLSPHYASPNVDNGYDISDYRAVNPQFGTMADFEKMVAEIRRRGMKLIVDLVVNHTSDQHTWFRRSRSGRDNPYRDFYIWRDGKDGGPPNNYTSFFGGGAWKKDTASGQYYLHYFAEQQPDLNWANPKVRAEVYDIMRFWLAKGVSGFRMDVIPFISKPENLRDLTAEELRAPEHVYANGPRIHDYLREMNREALSHGAPMTVGEAFGVTFDQTPDFVSQRRRELDMVFHFDVVRLGRNGWRPGPWTVPQLKSTLVRDDRSAGDDGWTTSFFENHDNPRSVSVFGDNTPASAKALAVILLGRRGTPFIYQGQEIGMTNITFASIDDFADVDAKGVWREQVLSGKEKPDTVLAALRQTSRDNARAPMQWTSGAHAGFTTGTPWFRVNRNAMRINVETQRHDPDSVFLFYRRLLTVRKQHPVLVDGTFEDLDPEHPAVCAFLRQDTTARLLVLVNLTQKPQRYRLPRAAAQARMIVSTHDGATTLAPEPELQPWEAGFYALEG